MIESNKQYNISNQEYSIKVKILEQTNTILKNKINELQNDIKDLKTIIKELQYEKNTHTNFQTIMRDEVLNTLEQQRNDFENENKLLKSKILLLEQIIKDKKFVNQRKKIYKQKIDIWDMLNLNSSASKIKIKQNLNNLLKQYHPDKVINSGQLLQKIANDITKQLLEFKKLFT